jgi:hypothetical protein
MMLIVVPGFSEILFPSLIIAPIVLGIFFALRPRIQRYASLWKVTFIICILCCLLEIAVGIMMVSMTNGPRKNTSPDSGSAYAILFLIAILVVEGGIIIPSVPILAGLSFLNPKTYQFRQRLRWRITALLVVVLFVASISGLRSAYATNIALRKQQQHAEALKYQEQMKQWKKTSPTQEVTDRE